jgi:hypothetical protein
VVADAVLEDALEEKGQFLRRARGVFLGKLEHRVLDDVERRLFVLDREHALLEGAPFGRGEKVGQFFSSGQGALPRAVALASREGRERGRPATPRL